MIAERLTYVYYFHLLDIPIEPNAARAAYALALLRNTIHIATKSAFPVPLSFLYYDLWIDLTL